MIPRGNCTYLFSRRDPEFFYQQPVPASLNLSGSSPKITKVSVVEIKRRISNEMCKLFKKHASVSCGVPQGSILGPLLFLIYVNDMSQAIKCDVFLYADGSCLVCQHKDVNKIQKHWNEDFSDIFDWLVDN